MAELPPTPDSDPREEDLFHRAAEITNLVERGAFLDAACAGRPGLRERVEHLLTVRREADAFFRAADEGLAGNTAGESTVADGEEDRSAGEQIGEFRLIRKIGEGGFGVVYLAEQSAPVRRKVALKIIRAGRDSRQVIRRFETERQAIALMDHPHIARIYGGGETEDGLPYFAMEWVNGPSITDYCRTRKLSLRQMLELFSQVCAAVQHAHTQGIIHRDIKPSNILVTEVDGLPMAKIIDFGVAKALGASLFTAQSLTESFQVLGTLLYMCPEQAAANNSNVDIRADVYSLGTVLYELLTGNTPVTRKELGEVTLLQALKTIQEREPPKPSTRLREVLAGHSDQSPLVNTEIRTLCREVQGELDWIVMRALERDRDRRYQSAAEFRQDVHKYLSNQPVSARPPSAAYLARKFASRHRRGMLVASATVAIIALGWGLNVIQQRRQRAETLVSQLLAARPAAVPGILSQLESLRSQADRPLRRATENGTRLERFRADLGLVKAEASAMDRVIGAMSLLPPEEVVLAVAAAGGSPEAAMVWAWERIADERQNYSVRLRAAAMLARHDPANPRWASFYNPLANWLVQEEVPHLGTWIEEFKPIAPALIAPLKAIYSGSGKAPYRVAAAITLASYLAEDIGSIIELMTRASPGEMPYLLAALRPRAAEAVTELEHRFVLTQPEPTTAAEREERHLQRMRLGMASLALGGGAGVWQQFAELMPADPTFRTHLIHNLAEYQIDPAQLVNRLLGEPNTAIRQALLSALGDYDIVALPMEARTKLLPTLSGYLHNEPVGGTRAMAEWLMRSWGAEAAIQSAKQTLVSTEPAAGRDWYVTPTGYTMIVIRDPPLVELGARELDTNLVFPNPRHLTRIPRSFAISAETVVMREFRSFLGQHYGPQKGANHFTKVQDGQPDLHTGHADAQRFCNWLSLQEGIPTNEWCYAGTNANNAPAAVENHLARRGYRLPTEAEWEYACRSGAVTERADGNSGSHLDKYVWHDLNSQQFVYPPGRLRPNALGLFDGLGNAFQWSDDWYVKLPNETATSPHLVDDAGRKFGAPAFTVFRGSPSTAHPKFHKVSLRFVVDQQFAYVPISSTIRLARTISDP